MSLETKYFYDFGDFRLDLAEKVLLRDGKFIPITPKVFETLCVLVESAGHLIEKDELMQKLWQDRFVEESNLTFNVGMLRKALGDDASNPTFIETVQRRGYRFIAKVRRVETAEADTETRRRGDAEKQISSSPDSSSFLSVSASHKGAISSTLADWRRDENKLEEFIPVSALEILTNLQTAETNDGLTRQSKRHKPLAALTALIDLFSAIGAGYRFFAGRVANTEQIESVAVLPFVNVSADPETEYLSDGISESLIDRLSQLPQLKVIARSSSFKYSGENIDIQDAANKLGVQAIITGRVARSGDNLSIRAELVDALDNRQLWSEQYNRRAADILIIQQEIAQTVSLKLRLKLSGAHEQGIAKQNTVNPHAYELLLKGHAYRNKKGTENKMKAAEYYRQATDVDPAYASAYAALSVSYSDLTHNGILDPKEFTPKAAEAARKALELDESLAEAHVALALLKLNGWDWAAAEQEYRRALELSPNFAKARSGYAFYLSLVGRHDEAVAEFKLVKDMNPLEPTVNADVGYALYMARRYDEAWEISNNALQMDRQNPYTNGILAHCYLGKEMYAEAIAAFRHVIELGGEPGYRIYLGAAYAKSGERGRAQAILEHLETSENYVSPGELAILYVALGELEQAFASLERAYAARDAQLQFLLIEPAFDSLRSAPRFQNLLRRVGLPQRDYRFIAEVWSIEAEEAKRRWKAEEKKSRLSTDSPSSFHSFSSSHESAVIALADWRRDENKLEESAHLFAPENLSGKNAKLELIPAIPFVKNKRNNYLYLLAGLISVVVLLIFAVSLNSRFMGSKSLEADAPVLSAPFSSEKLSTNGKAVHAVVSPDGKNVVYTNGIRGKQSIWLRQLESANTVEIIPPSDDVYGGIAFSPDGNSLYFSRRPRNVKGQLDIYRISIFGGIPTKIVNEAQGWTSISPDGGKISFVRCYRREDENCSLWIADTNGGNERKLVSRPHFIRIGDNKISPDGKSIAFAVGQSNNAANEFGLVEVNIESGAQRELTTEKFFDIKTLAWLPGQNGLLIAASRIPNKNFRLWQVSTASGEASPLTKDSENYSDLSLDKAAGVIVATQTKVDFNLVLYKRENPSDKRILADATTVGFAPNGKIIFSSPTSGNDEVWSINADGSEQRQLTNDAGNDSAPVSSPDGNSIFFVSNRTGKAQIWRMNHDGSSQTQITDKEGGYPIFASPDGRWVYYHHGLNRTLWRVSTRGGEEQLVLNKEKYYFAFSPDGSRVAFSEKQGEEKSIVIVLLADGRTIKTIKYAEQQAVMTELDWLPDGKSLAYILVNNESDNRTFWLQPPDVETPQKIADLGEEDINSLAISPDGESFAVVQGGWKHDAVLLKGLK